MGSSWFFWQWPSREVIVPCCSVETESRRYRVLLLFGGERMEKLYSIIVVNAIGELCSRSSGLQGASFEDIKIYRRFVSVVT